jgi:nucleoside-diphosphate-sugar epimerase
MAQISILGCGWLGLPLAKALLKDKFLVKGSTTSVDKLSVLENFGIKPYLLALSEDKTIGNLTAFLESSEILIINIPPKLRSTQKENFVSKIKNIIPSIEKSSIENVLFISSTSVYGEDNLLVSEETQLNPDTESGKQLVLVEQLLPANLNFKTTILRFGGLIGEDRHPIKFLAGRKNIENPNAPINLIHLEDCIGIILAILKQKGNGKLKTNDTFNAVAPHHPSRQEYYIKKAIELNLALPEFNLENTSFGKTILSNKVETVLSYTFLKPNL